MRYRRPRGPIELETTLVLLDASGLEREVTVYGTFEPAEPGCYTMPNGDPGYPGYGADVVDIHATFDGTPLELTPEQAQYAREALLQEVYEDDDGPDPDSAWDSRGD